MTLSHQATFAALCRSLQFLGPMESEAEAWCILSHLTNSTRTTLLLQWSNPVPKHLYASISAILKKRQRGIPLAYILGKWSFYGHPITVHKGVLIPRSETELLVSLAMPFLAQNPHIFELGVGSGAIPMALAHTQSIRYDGWDISKRAIRNAEQNTQTFTHAHIRLHHENFFSSAAAWRNKLLSPGICLLISNPPYIAKSEMATLQKEVRDHEPWRALVGGTDGLSFYKRLYRQYLAPDSPATRHMLLEIGAGQDIALGKLMTAYPGYQYQFHKDFSGINRVMAIHSRQ